MQKRMSSQDNGIFYGGRQTKKAPEQELFTFI
jgi:hypothetical protein